MTRRTLLCSLGLLATASAAALCCTSGCSGPSGPVDGSRAYTHVKKFVEIGPRPFGSDALATTADYICDEIKKIGLVPERQEEEHSKEKKTIRNLFTRLDGPDPEQGPILIIGAHYDTKLTDHAHDFPFVGAIDGGGGPAVLLELARVIKARKEPLKCNVWLYWIDAEESIDWVWNDDRALLGSQAFCKWLDQENYLRRVKAFVLLDLIGDKNLKIDRDGNSSAKLLDLFATAAEEIGMRDRLYEFPTEAEVAALRQRNVNWGTKDDHIIFTRFSVPSVLLIDFARRMPEGTLDDRYTAWWHTADDDLSQVSADSLAMTGNLVMAALPRLEDWCLGKRN